MEKAVPEGGAGGKTEDLDMDAWKVGADNLSPFYHHRLS
jgi:hypothetical protein